MNDIRDLIKYADDEERIILVNLDRYMRTIRGSVKKGIAMFATGKRAAVLEKVIETLSETETE